MMNATERADSDLKPAPAEAAGPFHVAVTGHDVFMYKSHCTYAVHSVIQHDAYPEHEYTVNRRYSHFDWLVTRLGQEFPHLNVPNIPPKEFHVGNGQWMDPKFLEFRRRLLQKFLTDVAARPEFTESSGLKVFLTIPDDNFESACKTLPVPREFDESKKSVGMFAKLRSKATSTPPPPCENKFQNLQQIAVAVGKLAPTCHAAMAANEARVVTLRGYSEAMSEYSKNVDDLAKNSSGEHMQRIGKQYEQVGRYMDQMLVAQEEMACGMDNMCHEVLDHGHRNLSDGASRVYKGRQKALQLVNTVDVTGMDPEECKQNFDIFEQALPEEIELTKRRFMKDAHKLPGEFRQKRMEAILKEMEAWDQIERILSDGETM
eukprot:TRINITY_DN14936_c0_g1_i6.p1 TRINITY_DN14936_c0_g1~~TRINITY_DN14936_c0_g1_i6.p1  ORF type:complete len:375 (+),score=85.23 TRINITY_DN14936_c0_g1_i6:125-1249(+)